MTADTGKSEDKDTEFFKQFDIVIATTCNKVGLDSIFFYPLKIDFLMSFWTNFSLKKIYISTGKNI